MPRRDRSFRHTSHAFADKDTPQVKHGLAELVNQRHCFTAQFDCIRRTKSGRKTVLMLNLCRAGQPVADHVWIPFSGTIKALRLSRGSDIQFEGRVYRYVKGFAVWGAPQHDYGLDDIRDMQRTPRFMKSTAVIERIDEQ